MVVREENRGEEGKEASRERETERDRESTKDRERVRKCYGCCCCCCWRLQASSSPSSQCVQKELFSHHLLCGDGIMGIPLSLSLSLTLQNYQKHFVSFIFVLNVANIYITHK